jgi:hypothetical protein
LFFLALGLGFGVVVVVAAVASVAAVVFVQILPLCIFQTSITYIDVL